MTARLLLIEGVPCAGKSSLAAALLRAHAAGDPRTVLHLAQAHTYGPLADGEDRGTLTVARNLAHLETLVAMLEWHVRAVAAAAKPKLFAVVDTLYMTHVFRPGVVTWEDVAPFDSRLAALGARLIFLHVTPEILRARLQRRDPGFLAYAARLTGDVHRRFVDEQEAMRSLLARTRLPVTSVAGDAPVAELVVSALRS